MIRLQPVFRLILAAVSLLLSLQAPVSASPEIGRVGTIYDSGRKLIDGRDRSDEHAVLTVAVAGGNFATRNTAGGGGSAGLRFVSPPHSDATPERRADLFVSALREYRLRNAHIVLAQFQALFPKHWFW